MTDNSAAFRDIEHAFTVTHHVRFGPGTHAELQHIFDRTVGDFAGQAEEQHATAHPWEHEGFRTFILGQVERIAAELNTRALGKPVTPEMLRTVSREIMSRTNRVCRLRVERGQPTFATVAVPDGYQGDVCSMYLADAQ